MKKIKKALSFALTAALVISALLPLSAFAVDGGGLNMEPLVLVELEDLPDGVFDLTAEGAVDWIFVGNQKDKMENPFPQDQKKDASGEAVDIIQYGQMKDTMTWLGGTLLGDQNDIKSTYTWTDGVNNTSATETDGACLLYDAYGSWWSEGGVFPDGTEVGWIVTIPAAEETQVLTLYSGALWAGLEVSVYADGELVYVDNNYHYDTEQNRHTWVYTVTAEPGVALEVRGKLKDTGVGCEMICLFAATLSTLELETEGAVEKLGGAIEEGNRWLEEVDLGREKYATLKSTLSTAEALLERPDLTDEDAAMSCYFITKFLATLEADPGTGYYANSYAPGLTGFFGWEGDAGAPLAWADGSYQLPGNGNAVINFGVSDLPDGSVEWSRAEGYLPCLISQYDKLGMQHTVESFADEVFINERRYEVVFSRMTTTNTTDDAKTLPQVSSKLIPINEDAKNETTVPGGGTVVRDYCVFADRFNGQYTFPTDTVLAEQVDTFDMHFDHMKGYWNERLSGIVDIQDMPSEYARVTDAYKAAYIDLLIAADGSELHAGERVTAYERLVDTAALDMLTALVQLGHTDGFADYAQTTLRKLTSSVGAWQAAQPFAIYLQKTWDYPTVIGFFEDAGKVTGLRTSAHRIAADRVNYAGAVLKDGSAARIMKQTDSQGGMNYWTADNLTALNGLLAYRYICEQLHAETGEETYETERDWAAAEYESLLESLEAVLADAEVLPAAIGGQNVRGGKGSFLPGHSSWNSYLFGAEGNGRLWELVDQTYEAILQDASHDSDGISSGEAGCFTGALIGEAYRSRGIDAYLNMIENSMSAPYGWWENGFQSTDSFLLNDVCVPGGTGGCPHVSGQIANAQMLLDAFLAERADGTLIAGRGLPTAFNAPGERVQIDNYLCNSGQRIGYTMESTEKMIDFTLTGDRPEHPVSLELPVLKDNIAYVSGNCTFDSGSGTVILPVGTTSVTIGLKAAGDIITPVIDAIDAIGEVTTGSGAAIEGARAKYDALTEGQKALVSNYQKLVDAEKAYQDLLNRPSTGGSSSSGRPSTTPKTKTETNADGSKTTTVTDAKGNVTQTTEYAEGTRRVRVTGTDGIVTQTVTRPDGSEVKTVILPGESCTITVKTAGGKTAARVEIPAELPAAKMFEDIGAEHWARKGVDMVSALGLFEGTSERTFTGDAGMTRGMIVTVLHRLSGSVEAEQSGQFSDVSGGAWYAGAVDWAAEHGIVQGVGSGLFAPEEEISREMLITILCRYAALLGLDTNTQRDALAPFTDSVQVSAWAESSVAWAVEKGLISGGSGALRPGDTATRAEVAVILTGFIDLLSK